MTLIEVKAWLHGAAGLSLAIRNCGVIDDQIYIVDVDAAWAIRRFGTACRHAPGTARLLSGRFSFLSKLPRRRHGRAAMPPAKSQPIVEDLPQGFRKPRNVNAPCRRWPREWHWRIDSPLAESVSKESTESHACDRSESLSHFQFR